MLAMILFACMSKAPDTSDTGSVRRLVSEDLDCPADGNVAVPLDGRAPLQVFSLDVLGTASLWDDWKYSPSTLAIWCPDTGAVRVVWGAS